MTRTALRRPLGKRAKAWRTYEEVASHVLSHLADRVGLRDVKGKARLPGRSGTDWELDAQATRVADGAVIYVECRLRNRRISQGEMAQVAYAMKDVGAGGAITVSPLPVQKGAALIARAEGLAHVVLTTDSGFDCWVAEIAGLLHVGLVDRIGVQPTDHLHLVVCNAKGEIVEEVSI